MLAAGERHIAGAPRDRGSRRSLALALGFVAAATAATGLLVHPAPAIALDPRPNIVLIVTDDQRWDTLWAMPTVQAELVDHGVRFRNGFVTNPLCCPSRATILTGKYSHSTGVYTNKEGEQYGGFSAFDDSSTVATWLHDGGYRTGLFGKYLNGYPGTYVPPGWDRWFATGDLGFYDYPATDDGIDTIFGSTPEDYETTVLASKADEFIRSTPSDQPLFAYVTPHAPHDPATPGPGDEAAFSDLRRWRPPSFNEADVSDKPLYISRRPRLMSAKAEIDEFRRNQYRSLLAVDRLVGTVVQALGDTGRLANTMIVFTSDNGILWGEHRWRVKNVPYEESIRVPMVVRYDPLIPSRRSDSHLVGNVDLAPTAASLAGVSAPGAEGLDLTDLLLDRHAPWRKDFLLEHMSNRPDTNGPIPSFLRGPHDQGRVRLLPDRRRGAVRPCGRPLRAAEPGNGSRLGGNARGDANAALGTVPASPARPHASGLAATSGARIVSRSGTVGGSRSLDRPGRGAT